jgi:4-amino-4-deoxy-L-arabinose transferase-like glycosyltransferase
MNLRALSLALAGLLALIFLSQGLTAPFEKDEESRPAGIIADILHRGDWLLPADVYGEVTRKPPLYYWLSAGLAKVCGVPPDEAGARVVSVIAAAVLSVVVMGWANAWLSAGAGWLAWLFLMGSYGFCAHAGYARTDMLFTLLLFFAYCLVHPALEGAQSTRYWLGGGLMLGLAVLTKGPLAVVLCALGILIYLIATRRNPLELAARPWPWLTLAVAAAIASLWYLPALIKTHGAIAKVQLMQENFGHLVPARMGGTGEAGRPFYYIVARFVGASFPLSLYLPASLAMLWPLRRVGRPLLYQWSLLIAVLGLFSIASAKRDDYILPAFPPFALVLAGLITARPASGAAAMSRLRDWAGLIAAGAMLLAAGAGLFLSGRGEMVGRLAAHLQSSDAAYLGLFIGGFWHGRQAVLVMVIAVASITALMVSRRGNPAAVAAAVAIASMAAVSLWIGILRPGLAARRTFRSFALQMRQTTGGQPVYTRGGPDYEVSYYYGAPIIPLGTLAAGVDAKPRYLLTRDDQLNATGLPAGSWHRLLVSDAAVDGHHLVLLKIEPNRFEPSFEDH